MSSPRPRRSRPAFWVLTVLLVAAGVEAGSRVIERVENAAARRRNPYVQAVNPTPAFQVVETGGRRLVYRSGLHPLMVTPPPFPLERPPGGLRVFLLGGSAAAGWPYQDGDTSISAFLARKLRRLLPDRPVEVVNMAAGTYASHRVKLILEEVVRYQPDAILLYNGNNELLENLVYRPLRPPPPWDLLAAARLAWRVHAALTTAPTTFDARNYSFDDLAPTYLSFALGKASRYRDDPAQFRGLLEHYRYNMEGMVAAAAEARVPLLLVTCPVNLKDWTPNVSRHAPGLDAHQRQAWTRRWREAVEAQARGDWAASEVALRAALAIDPAWAEAHYRLGEALRRTGRAGEARAAYVEALRQDAYPFRELPELQAILREVAARTGTPLVDLLPPLEAASGDGIPGLDVFFDYVHLTEQGQEIAAQEMLRGLHARGLLPGVTREQVEAARLEVEPAFHARRDALAAEVSVQLAMLMHQDDRLERLIDEASAVLERAAREDPSLAGGCRQRLAEFQAMRAVAGRYARLKRAEVQGLAAEQFSPGEAQAIVDQYRELVFRAEGANLSREELLRRFPRETPLAGAR